MRYDPDKHHRQSIRLKGYDYSLSGAYFVTLCVQHRECLFGDVIGVILQANDAGQMVERWWRELTRKFPTVSMDEFVVMPNHLHGVLILQRSQVSQGSESSPLGTVMDWFKTMTTNEYIRGVKNHGWKNFPRRLWQRDYFDRIIRDQNEIEMIREYIRRNPSQWSQDPENPMRVSL
ncbi:MAG TPA: transposase [Thermoanaerobaculia bacterium]|jgi:REP element-mobilizing transposase RayT|nr:transposase [Thermoanaerobaculia bacterium]